MLKVKFWRIENVVLMKVLEQGEEIVRGGGQFFSTEKITLSSHVNPEMWSNKILVKGSTIEHDDDISDYICSNCNEAKNYILKASEAIHAYNQSLSKDSEQISDDIETVIAE